MASASSRYRAAWEELTSIRDRLATGQVPVDDIEDLTADAARAVQSARAALCRTGASIDVLGAALNDGPQGPPDHSSTTGPR